MQHNFKDSACLCVVENGASAWVRREDKKITRGTVAVLRLGVWWCWVVVLGGGAWCCWVLAGEMGGDRPQQTVPHLLRLPPGVRSSLLSCAGRVRYGYGAVGTSALCSPVSISTGC